MQGLNLHMLGNKFDICTYLYIICTCNGVSGMNTNHLVCKDHNTQLHTFVFSLQKENAVMFIEKCLSICVLLLLHAVELVAF